jgi:two-component system, OmpR family, phosphate regulon response regulator OmpR
MSRVLIIDDDVKLQDLLSEYLQGYGYEVFRHEEGNNVPEKAAEVKPDIILLDIMLPGKNGIDVLRELRATGRTPVIMLTAKGDEADRIVGLELGADDYIPKPFNARELLARIKAVLRRTSTVPETAPQREREQLSAGNFTLDYGTMTVECGEKKAELSKTEFRIMEALMKTPNTVLSRDTIMNIARGRDIMSFERSIDVHVSKLRSKVENLCGDKNRIKTVWGTGYMFIV